MVKELVFVSPHFDDAVGACGGLMHRLHGTSAMTIATVFTDQPDSPLSPFAEEIHALMGLGPDAPLTRLKENKEACRRLGCRSLNLGLQDAIYRSGLSGPLYKDTPALFGTSSYEDAPLPARIWECLREQTPPQAHYLFPLGRGGHIDHILTHQAGNLALAEGRNVGFYEESYYDTRAYHPIRQDDLPPTEDLLLTLDEAEAKVLAFSSYESQIPMLFGSMEEMRRYFLSERLSTHDTPVERYIWPSSRDLF